MKRAVLTGGAGFLGSHFAERLLAEGVAVVCVDNLITGKRRNVEHLLAGNDFAFVEHDVSEPFTIDGEVDYVLHLASPASPIDYLELPMETLKVGSYGTHNALEVARQKSARFFLASTSEVYGDPQIHPQPETYWGNVNSIGPRSVYDEAKRYAEAVTMAYHRLHGLEVRIVRIFNTYGPRMRANDGRVVPAFIQQSLTGQPLTIFGDGSQTRSFCYVDDLIDGFWRLLTSDSEGPVNLGNPTEMSIRSFADTVLELIGGTSSLAFKPLPTDDPKVRRPDIGRARAELGWEPRVPLDEGLARTIEDFRQRLEAAGEVSTG